MSGPDTAQVRRFARDWTRAIFGIGFVPMSAAETERLLFGCAGQLADALTAEPFSTLPAQQTGERLVRANFTDTAVLEPTVRLMADRLPALAPATDPGRVAALQAGLASGYAAALRSRTMTEQEQLSQSIVTALRASEARFGAIFAGAAIGIGISDVDGRILDINQAFADLLGHSVEELCQRTVPDLIPRGDPSAPQRLERFQRMARGELDHLRLPAVPYRHGGRTTWADLTVSLIRDEAGQPRHIVAMAADITERHLLQERLRHQALHDPLTGLANRRMFAERLEDAFHGAEPDSRVGLCVLDLDRFKYVNDSHGHEVGDELLVQVARRLEAYAGGAGRLVARMGGDEFVVLVPRSNGLDEVIGVAGSILKALAAPVTVGPHRLHVSTSIGVVEQPVAQTSASEITKAGDVTLQWAKADGRGRWALFDSERHARQLARYQLASTMAEAIDSDEFVLEYQPLVRLSDGAIRGVEALVRWRHPQQGLLPPDRFITEAEETGLIVPLGRWILREACRQAARWQHSAGTFVSVNLAVQQTHESDLVENIAAVLAETGLHPGLLQIELTESAVMAPAGEPLEALDRLAAMGVRIAIDDFGTGYSNLAYLRRLPVHALKLAGSFIEGLRDYDRVGGADEQIVANLIRLGHAIGLTVTAEAVETEAQADLLRALGCDLAQGWYLSRAAPAEQIESLFARSGAGRPA